jgi:PAS domain S-box-containing protein
VPEGRGVWARLIILGVVAAVCLSGALDLIEHKIMDARMRLLQRPASGEIVVVAIDGKSLQAYGYWPWPRGRHAELLDHLREAGAAEVALDIDFSAQASPHDDHLFEDALRRWGGRVALPVFKQRSLVPDQFIYSEPLPRFRSEARLVSVNVRPDSDGLVRRITDEAWMSDGSDVHTLVATFGDRDPDQVPAVFYLDYGIGAGRIPQISYSDVLAGAFDADFFRGKRVIVGATAIELGDIVPVPIWRAMPGVLVQAIAAESIAQDRMLQRLGYLPTLALVGLLVFVVLPRIAHRSWRAWFGAIAGVAIGTNLLALAVQAGLPILVDTTPYALAAVLAFAVETIGRSEQLSLRVLAQGLLISRQSRLMRSIVENTFDALVTTDGQGRIVAFNPAAERLFGHDADAMRGRPFSVLLADPRLAASPDDGAHLLALYAGYCRPEEALAQHADGTTRQVDLAVALSADTAPPLYVALIRDLSARKAAERLLQEVQQRLLDAIGSLHEGFALYDAEDRLVLCNDNYRRTFPAVAGLLTAGWRFDDIMHAHGRPEDSERRTEPAAWLKEMISRHHDPGAPYELLCPNGRWLQIGERRTGEGGVATIISDISELKRRQQELVRAKEEAELASRSKSEFLANMSHELRTPLNAVIGFAQMMESELFGPLGHKNYCNYAADIRRSGEHLLGVINDILDMARIEAGKAELNEEVVDLDVIADTATRLIAQRAAEGGVTVTLSLPSGLPALMADARLVKQCLINLLSNAVKFTPAGGRVEIRVDAADAGGLTLLVVDTGIGIAAEDIDRVMAPFGQAYGALDRRYEGTGLGLPLVKSYMQLHGGDLRLDSSPGKGTTAILLFPPHRLIASRLPAVASRV